MELCSTKNQSIILGLVHQRGPNHASRIVLRDVVRHANESSIAGIEEYRILQLMPCFSMPQYVRFHNHQHFVKIGILECTPRSLLKMNTVRLVKSFFNQNGFSHELLSRIVAKSALHLQTVSGTTLASIKRRSRNG